MLVARSFSYSPPRTTTSGRIDEKHSENRSREHEIPTKSPVRGFGWRPESLESTRLRKSSPPHGKRVEAQGQGRQGQSRDDPAASPTPPRLAHSLPEPSRPVTVPSRPARDQSQLAYARGRTNRRTSSESARPIPEVSPSVRNILAETAIPRRTSYPRPRPRKPDFRRISIDELVQEWKQEDGHDSSSFGSSPTMDLLLSAPGEELENQTVEEEDSSPSRSPSNESMPSLDIDSQSAVSLETPSTPPASVRGSARQKRKPNIRSSPRSVDTSEHPLESPTSPVKEDPNRSSLPKATRPQSLTPPRSISSASPKQPTTSPSPHRSSSLKSNLTASLDRLRSFSQTFSNFVAPSMPPEDHLSRAIFSNTPPYRPEMRPLPLSGPPTPQLRRYLNPHAFQPYDFHLHTTHVEQIDLEAAAAHAADDPRLSFAPSDITAIPLEQYGSGNPSAESESGRDGRLDTEARRQRHRREVRENPEFLRISVLELQMRRAGKVEGPIGSAAVGRRAWWLPPRCLQARGAEVHQGSAGERGPIDRSQVPERWIGASNEE